MYGDVKNCKNFVKDVRSYKELLGDASYSLNAHNHKRWPW